MEMHKPHATTRPNTLHRDIYKQYAYKQHEYDACTTLWTHQRRLCKMLGNVFAVKAPMLQRVLQGYA